MNLASLPHRAGPPKIQIFVSDLGATGVVRNAIAIANLAAASGFRVRLLTCRADGVLRDDVDEAVEVVELLEVPASPSRKMSLRRVFLAYRRHSREWRPDILFSAGNHGHLLSSLAWLGLPGVKILRISNDLDHSGDGSWFSRRTRSAKFRTMTALADRLVLVSHALHDHPRLSRHVRSGKALLIPNGVDIPKVRSDSTAPCPHLWLADDRIPVVIGVGRSAPQKNFPTLVRAFASAVAQRDLRLIILGGDQAETMPLRQLADSLGIGRQVDLVPAVANPFSFIAKADVLALPSRWEGSSNVLLEAMACGTPVIASRTAGDAPHVLDNGRFGELIDPLDEAQLAEAILRQTGDRPIGPGERAKLFDRGKSLAAYIKLFGQVIGRPEGRPLNIDERKPDALGQGRNLRISGRRP